ncbi:hypothetical protein PISMIDRAFT_13087 [Pisolithus microcarpus 441]|uniref:Uncharacterized protein n=1 Tax=Pisolithus microcarpus 441 TaxID=765257 RepID=A0A0C9Y6M9_9AGAM|nr:hypothetical protein PISMIDRAFT_13087 [Pisolithus microcarpus 441]
MSSSISSSMTIIPWEVATPEELGDKLGDSCLSLQQELEEEEWRKVQEADRIHREREAKTWK